MKLSGLLIFILLLHPLTLVGQSTLEDKIYGMLIGSAIGDAAGAPTEFAPPQRTTWDGHPELTKAARERLLDKFHLADSPRDQEPYGSWDVQPPAGTITDDTRWKAILMHALNRNGADLTENEIAHVILDFETFIPPRYHAISGEWLEQVRYASRWVIGDTTNAYPPERLWSGIPTVMGSMMMLPLAGLYPEDPETAYRRSYELSFFDNGMARDLNSALIAALSVALGQDSEWEDVKETIRNTDPYRYKDIPFMTRETVQWLDRAESLALRAGNDVNKLYSLLETELESTYWWEAWVPMVVMVASHEFTGRDPILTMQIILEFGYDTDSYMQVTGAFLGALHGHQIFSDEMKEKVNRQMQYQLGVTPVEWTEQILRFNSHD